MPTPRPALAITGLALRGHGVRALPDLSRALRDGRDPAGPMPAGPRRTAWVAAGGPEVTGAFVDDLEAPPDPDRWPWLHRLLGRVVQAAYDEAGRPTGRVGVFVGAAPPEGTAALAAHTELDVDGSIAAGRLARQLDVHGPTLVVDTACASGATALHLARQALLAGECDHAVVASASALAEPSRWARIDALGALSRTGHSRPFDDRADGFLRGEGAVALVLARRAPEAAALGWLVGSCSAHEGRTPHAGVPSAAHQAATARAALDDAGVRPDALALVHPHGTGTPLGDRVELEVLAQLFPGGPPALLATKAVLGHTEAPSALFAVAAALDALRTGHGPGLPHVARPVDGAALPLAAGPLHSEHALVLAAGLSGSLGALVLRRGPRAAAAVVAPHAAPDRAPDVDLRALVARLLDREPEAIDPARPLRDQGLDSVAAVALADALARRTGRGLRPTLALELGTLDALAAHLAADAPEPMAFARPAPGAAVALTAATVRLPGVHTLEALDTALEAARFLGGRLPDADGLDAEAVGLSAPEAEALGPTLRAALEPVHALADEAGLHGVADVGVFVASPPESPDPERGWGGPREGAGREQSFVAGRLAAHFGWSGPALVVNTACSSGLVATALALDALRAGRCRHAVVVGVRLHHEAADDRQLDALGVLSPSGRLRPFDAGADGTVRGEGVVAIALARHDALDGRQPLAGLRAVAVAHDHAAGLAAPSVEGQHRVLRAALAEAGLPADALAFVEAHGTGTARGDAVEARALHRTLGTGRPLTAAKGVFGHLEHAAGLLGLVAAARQLDRGRLAPVGGLTAPSPALESTGLVPVGPDGHPLPADARFAGVSSFGVSGTVAHAVLERVPPRPPPPAPPRPVAWPLYGRDAAACDALLDALVHRPEPPGAVARALAARRGAWVAVARPDATGAHRVGPARPVARPRPVVAWLCPGAGGWRPGLGDGLMAHPTFRAVVDEARAVVEPILGPGLLATADADIAWRQVDTVVVTLGLAALLEEAGLAPDHVAGHSVGELAAGVLAGVLSRTDALRAAAARGRLYRDAAGDGAMVAVPLGGADAEALAGSHGLAVAVRQHPAQSVLAGPTEAVERVAATIDGARRLAVPGAWHHDGLADLGAAFADTLRGTPLHAPTRPWRSGLEGAAAPARWQDPDHWGRSVAAPVDWSAVVRGLLDDGVTAFVELGPQPLLLSAVAAHPGGETTQRIASLSRDRGELDAWADLLGAVAALGTPLAPRAWGPDTPPARGLPRPPRAATLPLRAPTAPVAVPLRVPVAHPLAAVGPAPARTLPTGDDPQRATLEAMQALAADPTLARVGLRAPPPWLGPEGADDLAAAAVAGALRCVQRERPLALGPEAPGEPLTAQRPGGPVALRLAEVPPGPAPTVRGAWLITGGTGALGLAVARWLCDAGAERVVLLSRSGTAAPDAGPVPHDAVVVRGDAAERAAIDAALATAGPGLVGVVHAVGALDDRPFARLDADAIARVMGGKVDGARHLLDALAERPDVRVLLFGSAAALYGSPGQAAYGAANAVLDALAVGAHARGRRVTSLAWGPWARVGLAARGGPAVAAQQRALGLRPLAPEAALAAFAAVLERTDPVVVVVDLDLERTRAAWPDDPLLGPPTRPTPPSPSAPTDPRAVAEAVAGHALDPTRRLDEQGFDSFHLVELANALAAAGHPVPLERVLAGGPLDTMLATTAAVDAPPDVPNWAWAVVLGVGMLLGAALATVLAAVLG